MAEPTRHTYTIRIPEQVAAKIEAQAMGLGIAPTTLLQSLITGQFENGATERAGVEPAALAKLCGKLDALRKTCELLGQKDAERYGQLLFEVVKTRSALLHSLDQNLNAPMVDEIIEASEKTARQYIDLLADAEESKQ